jgi:hypothetical protein
MRLATLHIPMDKHRQARQTRRGCRRLRMDMRMMRSWEDIRMEARQGMDTDMGTSWEALGRRMSMGIRMSIWNMPVSGE